MENVFGILGWIVSGLFFLFALFAFTGAPYVPTLRSEAEKVFKKLYRLGHKDLVVDLGSGDGTVLVAAAKCGAKVYGIELNPILVLISRFRLRKFKHARVDLGNIFNCKFNHIISMFSKRFINCFVWWNISRNKNNLVKVIIFFSKLCHF